MDPQQESQDDSRPSDHMDEYLHGKSVKKGHERLDRRPAAGTSGNPKKQGHGGKFTWEGPILGGADYDQPPPVALDERDPNYVDEKEEARDVQVAVGIVEVPKMAGSEGVVARSEQ